MYRREFLTAGTVIAGVSIAGCLGDDEPSDESSGNADAATEGEEDTGTSTEGEDDSEKSLELLEHEFYEEDEYNAGVRGMVANNSGEEASYVEISVEFLNAEGTRIDDNMTNTTDLDDGQQWEFEIMFLGDDPSEVDEYNIELSDTAF